MLKMYSCDKENDALAVNKCPSFTEEMQVNTGEAIFILVQFFFSYYHERKSDQMKIIKISSGKYHSIIMQLSWVLELAGNKILPRLEPLLLDKVASSNSSILIWKCSTHK